MADSGGSAMHIDEAGIEERAKRLAKEALEGRDTHGLDQEHSAHLFNVIDVDGDGIVSAEEIAAASAEGSSRRTGGMDCVVVSDERLKSLQVFLNEKMTDESTNEFYRKQVEVVNGAGRASDAKIASHYRLDSEARRLFYEQTGDATTQYYQKKEEEMDARLGHAIEQSEADLESRDRLAEENAAEKMERLDRMRENNGAYLRQIKEGADSYAADVQAMHDKVHGTLAKVQASIKQAASRRIPEEWLTGSWAWTPASSLMGSMPATPATPGTAHTDTWDVRSAGGSAASSSRPLTGVTEPPASREGAATGPAGLVGRGGIGEEAQVEAVHSTGGGVVEPKPPPPDDKKEVRALTKEIFGMADADNDAYVSQAEFDEVERQLMRPGSDADEWAAICSAQGMDPLVGLRFNNFLDIYSQRTQEAQPELTLTQALYADCAGLAIDTSKFETQFQHTAPAGSLEGAASDVHEEQQRLMTA